MGYLAHVLTHSFFPDLISLRTAHLPPKVRTFIDHLVEYAAKTPLPQFDVLPA